MDNDLGITYAELLAVAAREMGFEYIGSSGDIASPEDDYDLAAAKRIVRRALRRVTAADTEWIWLLQRITINLVTTAGSQNVDGDPARYRMPYWFGGSHMDDWQYTGSLQPLYRPRVVNRNVFADLTSDLGTDVSADPEIITFRKLTPAGGGDDPGWELVVHPAPVRARTLEGTVRAFPENMSEDGHRFVAGPEYSRLIETAVLLEAAAENAQDMLPMRQADYQEALGEAKRMNAKTKPRYHGTLVRTLPRVRENERLDGSLHSGRVTSATVNGQSIV